MQQPIPSTSIKLQNLHPPPRSSEVLPVSSANIKLEVTEPSHPFEVVPVTPANIKVESVEPYFDSSEVLPVSAANIKLEITEPPPHYFEEDLSVNCANIKVEISTPPHSFEEDLSVSPANIKLVSIDKLSVNPANIKLESVEPPLHSAEEVRPGPTVSEYVEKLRRQMLKLSALNVKKSHQIRQLQKHSWKQKQHIRKLTATISELQKKRHANAKTKMEAQNDNVVMT